MLLIKVLFIKKHVLHWQCARASLLSAKCEIFWGKPIYMLFRWIVVVKVRRWYKDMFGHCVSERMYCDGGTWFLVKLHRVAVAMTKF